MRRLVVVPVVALLGVLRPSSSSLLGVPSLCGRCGRVDEIDGRFVVRRVRAAEHRALVRVVALERVRRDTVCGFVVAADGASSPLGGAGLRLVRSEEHLLVTGWVLSGIVLGELGFADSLDVSLELGRVVCEELPDKILEKQKRRTTESVADSVRGMGGRKGFSPAVPCGRGR